MTAVSHDHRRHLSDSLTNEKWVRREETKTDRPSLEVMEVTEVTEVMQGSALGPETPVGLTMSWSVFIWSQTRFKSHVCEASFTPGPLKRSVTSSHGPEMKVHVQTKM